MLRSEDHCNELLDPRRKHAPRLHARVRFVGVIAADTRQRGFNGSRSVVMRRRWGRWWQVHGARGVAATAVVVVVVRANEHACERCKASRCGAAHQQLLCHAKRNRFEVAAKLTRGCTPTVAPRRGSVPRVGERHSQRTQRVGHALGVRRDARGERDGSARGGRLGRTRVHAVRWDVQRLAFTERDDRLDAAAATRLAVARVRRGVEARRTSERGDAERFCPVQHRVEVVLQIVVRPALHAGARHPHVVRRSAVLLSGPRTAAQRGKERQRSHSAAQRERQRACRRLVKVAHRRLEEATARRLLRPELGHRGRLGARHRAAVRQQRRGGERKDGGGGIRGVYGERVQRSVARHARGEKGWRPLPRSSECRPISGGTDENRGSPRVHRTRQRRIAPLDPRKRRRYDGGEPPDCCCHRTIFYFLSTNDVCPLVLVTVPLACCSTLDECSGSGARSSSPPNSASSN